MKKERIEWLDSLKGLSIILVVFCHNVLLSKETVIGNIFMTLAWAACPCFMMVSGALLHQAKEFNWKKYFKRLVNTYLVFVVWRLIYFLFQTSLNGLGTGFGKGKIVQYLFFLGELDGIDTGGMWYMVAYMVVFLFYPLTFQAINHGKEGTLVLVFSAVVAGVGGIVLPSIEWSLRILEKNGFLGSFSVNGISRLQLFSNYGNMIFYYLTGALLFKYQEHISEHIKKKICSLFVALIGVLGLMFVKFLDYGTFTWNNQYLKGGYTHISTVIISYSLFIMFMLFSDKWGKLNHFLSKCIGRHTLGIYYIHVLVLMFVSKYYYHYIVPYYGFLANVIKTIVVLLISVSLTILLKLNRVTSMLVR